MKNLRHISENPHLAPQVKVLQFATGYVSDEFPGIATVIDDSFDEEYDSEFEGALNLEPEDYLPDDIFARLLCFRNHRQPWFPASWDWTPCHIHFADTVEKYAITYQKQGVIEFLAKTMSKLHSLHSIEYKADYFPASFEDLRDDIMEAMEEQGAECWEEPAVDRQAMDVNGVDMILCALATGSVRLKHLSIPVPAASFHAIATHTSPEIVRKVLASVESLRIDEAICPAFYRHLNTAQKVILSSSNSPELRLMSWVAWPTAPIVQRASENNADDARNWITAIPPDMAFPSIHKLDLCDSIIPFNGMNAPFDQNFLDYLKKIGGTLKTLSFRVTFYSNWAALIRFLATSPDISLQDLIILYKDRTVGSLIHEAPTKEALYQAAQVVSIEPPTFKEHLEKRWASKKLVD
jgi:hypothetical protein